MVKKIFGFIEGGGHNSRLLHVLQFHVLLFPESK